MSSQVSELYKWITAFHIIHWGLHRYNSTIEPLIWCSTNNLFILLSKAFHQSI